MCSCAHVHFHTDVILQKKNRHCFRLRLNNAGPDDSVVVGIFYSNPQRLDVHYKQEYVPALNMEKDAKGKYQTKPGTFMPTPSMDLGALAIDSIFFAFFCIHLEIFFSVFSSMFFFPSSPSKFVSAII